MRDQRRSAVQPASNPLTGCWPKQRPELTEEQKQIVEDWYKYWLTIMPKRFAGVTRFNHVYPLRTYRAGARTLEVGPGKGEHLLYESLDHQEYYAIELRPNLADEIRAAFPQVKVIVGDCQAPIDAPDCSFDRVLAIHVLEHLAHLPAAIAQVHRLLKPDGRFSVVIPCEGGFAYKLGRMLTVQRIFEKRYKTSYEWHISHDHINRADEILNELCNYFVVLHSAYYPLFIPFINTNLVIGLTLSPK